MFGVNNYRAAFRSCCGDQGSSPITLKGLVGGSKLRGLESYPRSWKKQSCYPVEKSRVVKVSRG